MSRLVCPMCSEELEEEGDHFYKHFKYKKFPCGETGCKEEFYTGVKRNAHCTEMKHKRSFQNHVNPYMDKLVSIVVADARALAANGKDIDATIKSRWGSDANETSSSAPVTSSERTATDPGKKKRNSAVSSNTNPAAKKTKSLIGAPSAKSTFATTSADSSTRTSDDSAAQATSSTSSMNLPNPVADSTTNDIPQFETPTLPAAKKQRKKRDSATSSSTQKTTAAAVETEEEIPDDIKVECQTCRAKVPYQLQYRHAHAKTHVTDSDETSDDYEQVLEGAVNKAFPGLPNGVHNCQLCMEPEKEITLTKQREHIETRHKNEIPELQCPKCDRVFEQQCRLSAHMRDQHGLQLTFIDSEFQERRTRRNEMIKALRKKYFPISYKGKLKRQSKKQPTTPAQQPVANPPSSYEPGSLSSVIVNDIRVVEARKTRRAPRYQEQSDSSDDENEDEEEEEDDDTSNTVPIDCSADIIFVEQRFMTEVQQKLLSRASSMVNIKKEVVDPADGEETKEEEKTPSPKPDEQQRPPTPIYAKYEPTVPPPGYAPYPLLGLHSGVGSIPLPPPPLNRPISPSSTISAPATTRDRDRSGRERTQSPPRRHRSPYDNNRQSSSSTYNDDRRRRGGGSSSRSYVSGSGGRYHNHHHHQNRGGGGRAGGEERGAQSENESRGDRGRSGGYRSYDSPYYRSPSSNSSHNRGRSRPY
ncbi:unnamed protein product [Caenorhabditis brenneri]